MANEPPITEISLPTHHPAVKGLAAGGHVRLIARKAIEPEPTMPEDRATPKNQRPAPVTTRFHVTSISKHRAGNGSYEVPDGDEKEMKATQRKIVTPMDRVKAKRKSAPPTTTSRAPLLPASSGGMYGSPATE